MVMHSLSMTASFFLLTLILECSTIKENILPSPTRKLLTTLLPILTSKSVIISHTTTDRQRLISNSIFMLLVPRFLSVAVENSKKSPELIQLLDMHTHFSAATPGTKVCNNNHMIQYCAVSNYYTVFVQFH